MTRWPWTWLEAWVRGIARREVSTHVVASEAWAREALGKRDAELAAVKVRLVLLEAKELDRLAAARRTPATAVRGRARAK